MRRSALFAISVRLRLKNEKESSRKTWRPSRHSHATFLNCRKSFRSRAIGVPMMLRWSLAPGMKFDFGEIKTSLPATVKAIESFDQNDTVSVRFAASWQSRRADVPRGQKLHCRHRRVGCQGGRYAAPPPPPSRSDDVTRFGTEAEPRQGSMAALEAPQPAPASPTAQRPASVKRQPRHKHRQRPRIPRIQRAGKPAAIFRLPMTPASCASQCGITGERRRRALRRKRLRRCSRAQRRVTVREALAAAGLQAR